MYDGLIGISGGSEAYRPPLSARDRTMAYGNSAAHADLGAVYDFGQAAPDYPSYLAEYESAAGRARLVLPNEIGVRYGPSLDERINLFPAIRIPERAPIIIFIPGAYWRLSEENFYDFVALGLRSYAAIGVVNHGPAPKAPIGEVLRQVRAAIAWAWNNVDRLGGDRESIYLVGHSAGAHLGVMAAVTEWAGEYGLPDNVIKGVFAISGLYDLRPLPFCPLGQALQLSARDVRDLSPMLRVLPRRAPHLTIAYGAHETPELIRQNDDFLSHWCRAGLRGARSIRSERNHLSVILDLADPQSALVRDIALFMGP